MAKFAKYFRVEAEASGQPLLIRHDSSNKRDIERNKFSIGWRKKKTKKVSRI